MMFSTKAEYGVRVMAHLARAAAEAGEGDGSDGGAEAPISLGSIADAEGLPLAYLEHLVQRLRRADLVESRRGAHGGYTLARPAETIAMAEVVRALEGEIAPIECITADPERGLVCVREGELGDDPCPTKLLWTRVQGSIVRTLNEMTLADLVTPARPAKPQRSRDGETRQTKTDRGADRPAEVTLSEKATA
jgi:Rrf2 family cysteine metabolism transcriptional repressor